MANYGRFDVVESQSGEMADTPDLKSGEALSPRMGSSPISGTIFYRTKGKHRDDVCLFLFMDCGLLILFVCGILLMHKSIGFLFADAQDSGIALVNSSVFHDFKEETST